MTVNTSTHYETLNLAQDATQADIKKAYRKLSMIHHPDTPTGDEETFKIIKDAYEILSDGDARAHYDSELKTGAASANSKPQFTGQTQDTYSDIFNSRKDKNAPERGKNRYAEVTVSFEEAVIGATKDVPVRVHTICTDCGGKGRRAPLDAPLPCTSCSGTRKVVTAVTNPFGHTATNTRICPDCKDTQVEDVFCTDCNGKGSFSSMLSVPVTVPIGVANNTKVRVKNFGEEGINGGDPGDLIVTINVEESAVFERIHNDLHVNLVVSYTDLVLGNTITVPTLEGEMSLTIQKGTEPNTVFRLKGKGVDDLINANTGDLVITIKLQIPTDLTSEQEELLRSIGL